ncbi:MYG1 family protein [Oceanisphaera avium]|uniref:Metal-dependent hydrolase n=1 Tax=Oceanisphaera avium TaxID=1903694 RepID=A0A1Y0CWT6_9GAMM|nr:MYG1 family protein [Oceanisphaera avium]ART79325.1 metal-dependent hydrolase [Oceanisphaera avium]
MTITIVTHSGKFHADDVFSVAALTQLFPDAKVVRTRDAKLIAAGDIVVDVGQEYDAAKGRFDHHQRHGAGERDNGIPYSSFGLVWRHFGLDICQGSQPLWQALDTELVSVIDAIDCGYTGQGRITGEGERGVSLSQTIGLFNPTWQEPAEFDSCFKQAVTFASQILTRFIASHQAKLNAYQQVVQAIEQAEDPRIVVLEQYLPWKQAIHEQGEQALYVIYPSPALQWMIQAVAVTPDSFTNKKSLPASWAGLTEEELQQVTGVSDARFCHNGRFIAAAASLAGALSLAELALK